MGNGDESYCDACVAKWEAGMVRLVGLSTNDQRTYDVVSVSERLLWWEHHSMS